ncbi:MAG: hypothetical protein ABIS92_05945 [Polyangia bacterium]
MCVFLGALVLYLLTSYAGIRSPDAEVAFEVCDGLRQRGDFAVNGMGDSSWVGFGLAPGVDGRRYSIFGPLQPIACVPFLTIADGLGAVFSPPRSHYIDGGIPALLRGTPPSDVHAHARRSVVSWIFNSLVGAACVLVFFRALLRLASFRGTAVLLAAIYGAATLAWPYSGTFLSEPLATLLVLVSFILVLRVIQAPDDSPPLGHGATAVGAGAALGLAVTTHLTAILFLPFWLLIICGLKLNRATARRLMPFVAGVLPWLVLLAIYNRLRFGSYLETGRGLGADEFRYGGFQAPWRGLYGLTISPGKGLLLFCPATLLGLLGWRSFHRRHRVLSIGLACGLVVRLLFVATRSDWHGGFCLGPRYLVMAVPFLVLPAVTWLDELCRAGRWRVLTAVIVFAALCSMEQLMFVLGEIFSYLHLAKFGAVVRQVDPFAADAIYLRWEYSPLVNLLAGTRGPYVLKSLPLSNEALWLCGAAVLAMGWMALSRWLRRSVKL